MTTVKPEKILIAMSGGVDSSVAALLLSEAGCECVGATMRLFHNEDAGVSREKSCCSLEDVEDARSVAYQLGMPFYVFNFTDGFGEQVMDRFVDAYERGATPNPCIDCNRYMKFAKLVERAELLGCDAVATGHYARIEQENGRWLLKKAVDDSKDQSYVLYFLNQHQLAHLRFPLGTLHKTEAREIAEKHGLVNARKRDSQDICFVPDGVPCALGASAEPDCRTIAVDGVPIPPPPEHVYLMLYKPRGYITTLSDERGRRTAASLVDCGTRVYPVGRLDYDSEGLLLFTNDGALADRLMHPRREISKVYEVTARGPLDGAAERLRRPLVLDGYRIRPPEVEQTAPGRFLITIHEGRNRQIRRMCAAAGLEVLRLRRIAEGPLQLGTLAPGAWRPLTEAELAALRQETEGGDPV